ncbi:MAG: heavy metal translocating P-type ATPase [Polyangiaceae bacterium]|nr:heavy metal translocating P-type ATPase [Polyangiaceae bacterium]
MPSTFRTEVANHSATLFVASLLGLACGGISWWLGEQALASAIWASATTLVLVPTLVSCIGRLARRETGVDVIAVLAMGGAIALSNYFAGAVIAVMLCSGAALERFAAGRARRELTALLGRAPKIAHLREGELVTDVDIHTIESGQRLVIRPGEVIPVDGVLVSPNAVLDEAALTGEAKPVEVSFGMRIRSGGANAGQPLELRATSSAADSTYAGIIRLVRAAETSKAALTRLADRYALWFVGLTLVVACLAWLVSANPVRALAVLVVATPCPLLLAAPAAIIGGVSRAARYGVIVKGGAALETLARATVVLVDKTGTVTTARPRIAGVELLGSLSADEIIRLAASLEQVSAHPYAPPILGEARSRGLRLEFPTNVSEQPGEAIVGRVSDSLVGIGRFEAIAPNVHKTPELRSVLLRSAVEGTAPVFVAVDGAPVAALLLEDEIRAEAPRALRDLRRAGIRRIHMVTGDHPDVAELVGDALGIDRVFAERTPEEKVEVVRTVRKEGVTLMLGDGINDAPALALADVGVAIGARGATAASEAADVVLTSDRLGSLLAALRIARRTRRIAVQSIFVGMGLSVAAMAAAAAGFLAPAAGAILQEGIDVLAILNALRTLGGPDPIPRGTPGTRRLAGHLAASHQRLRPRIGEIGGLASRLQTLPPSAALSELIGIREMLDCELLPHEIEEQRIAYPAVAELLADEDPTGPLIQTHHEIRRLARLYDRLVAQLPSEGPRPEDIRDLRRILYGLHAILTLHFAQEDELYSLFDGATISEGRTRPWSAHERNLTTAEGR